MREFVIAAFQDIEALALIVEALFLEVAMSWKPMSANPFPWEHTDVILVAFAKDDPDCVEVFRCTCAEHGAYFPKNGGMLSLIEQGWIPFAWRDDDAPARDDDKFPPMMTDYLTEPMTEKPQ